MSETNWLLPYGANYEKELDIALNWVLLGAPTDSNYDDKFSDGY